MIGVVFAFDFAKVLGDALVASVGVQAAAFALAAIGLNVHYGYTGLLNFGQVAFLAAGAYGVAITTTQIDAGWSIWLGIVVGMGAAVLLALLMGLPTLRLRADYLAMTTIAVGEILRVSLRSSRLENVTGGTFSLPRPDDPPIVETFRDLNPFPDNTYGLWRVNFNEDTLWVMVVGWAMVALVSLLVWGLVRAPWGRVLRAIREDEDAARAVGKNAFAYKLQSLVLGGVIGAFAGMIRLFDSGSVNTISFLPRTTFFIWTVLILGGAATIRGPIAGAIAFWFIIIFSEGLLRQATQDDILPGWLLDPDQVSAVRWIIMGIMLGSLMIWRPQGMFGNREETLIDVFKS